MAHILLKVTLSKSRCLWGMSVADASAAYANMYRIKDTHQRLSSTAPMRPLRSA